MIVEESIAIRGSLEKVWSRFSDVSGWRDWNSVLQYDTTGGPATLEKGRSYRWRLRVFSLPLHFEAVIEEVSPPERIVWRACRFGFHARHEFRFHAHGSRTTVTSRETFRGIPPALTGKLFIKAEVRKLTARMLQELKRDVERGA